MVKAAEVSSASDVVGVTIRSLIELLAFPFVSPGRWEVDHEREGFWQKGSTSP
jgi:hypothetical protein